jgi:hypothetical protein
MDRDQAATPLHVDSQFDVFAEESVVTVIWKQPPVLAGVHAIGELFRQQHARSGSFGHLAVIEPEGGHDMAPAVRKELTRHLEHYAAHLAGSAIAFTATGFVASVIRSVVFAIASTLRTRYPMKVEQDLEACTVWLAEHLRKRNVTCDPQKLLDAVQTRRTRG